MLSWIAPILKLVIWMYILWWIIFWLINTFFAPLVCSANEVVFSLVEYKAYIDTMFPLSMWIIKLVFIFYIILWLYKKVTNSFT